MIELVNYLKITYSEEKLSPALVTACLFPAQKITLFIVAKRDNIFFAPFEG